MGLHTRVKDTFVKGRVVCDDNAPSEEIGYFSDNGGKTSFVFSVSWLNAVDLNIMPTIGILRRADEGVILMGDASVFYSDNAHGTGTVTRSGGGFKVDRCKIHGVLVVMLGFEAIQSQPMGVVNVLCHFRRVVIGNT